MQAIQKNIAWEFTDKKVTAWGGLRPFKEFLDRTNIRQILEESDLPWPGSNCGYNPVDVIESFWVGVWLTSDWVDFAPTTSMPRKRLFGV